MTIEHVIPTLRADGLETVTQYITRVLLFPMVDSSTARALMRTVSWIFAAFRQD
jgi:hypothetical protein